MSRQDNPTTKEKKITIIPGASDRPVGAGRIYQTTRPLLVLLSLLAILLLLHMVAAANLPALPASGCSSLLHNTDYTRLIRLKTPGEELGAIDYQEGLIPGQAVTLVPVIHTGQPGSLDLVIFSCNPHIEHPGLQVAASWRHLIDGHVSISKVHTLLISSQTTEQPAQQIYHEYSWQPAQNGFTEIAFPGLYPVLSRGEAEELQNRSNSQDGLPWHDPQRTAAQLGLHVLGWLPADFKASLLSRSATDAQVKLEHNNPDINVLVTLKRLINSDQSGLWFVTGAQTPGMLLSQPAPSARVGSPISLLGIGTHAGSELEITLLNHAGMPITPITPDRLSEDSHGQFSGRLSYPALPIQQPGLLLIESLAGNDPGAGQLFLSNLLLK